MTNITVDLQLRSKWFVRSMPLRFSFQRDGLRGNPIQTLILEPSANLCNSRSRLSYTRFKRFLVEERWSITDKYRWSTCTQLWSALNFPIISFFFFLERQLELEMLSVCFAPVSHWFFSSVTETVFRNRWLSWKLEMNCSILESLEFA